MPKDKPKTFMGEGPEGMKKALNDLTLSFMAENSDRIKKFNETCLDKHRHNTSYIFLDGYYFGFCDALYQVTGGGIDLVKIDFGELIPDKHLITNPRFVVQQNGRAYMCEEYKTLDELKEKFPDNDYIIKTE